MLNWLKNCLALVLVTSLAVSLSAEDESKPSGKAKSTLGVKPPKGALILFDGNINEFTPGKTTEDGTLAVPQRSRRIHCELSFAEGSFLSAEDYHAIQQVPCLPSRS